MNPRPVSLASARSGRIRVLLALALAVGVLSACDDGPVDPPPLPRDPGEARLEVLTTSVEPGSEVRLRCVADDSRGSTLTYVFDWGDGSDATHSADEVPSGTAVEQARVILEIGGYQARCRAMVAQGKQGPWSASVGYTVQPPQEGSGRLEVRVDVFGRGRVTTTPARLDCPANCRGWFDAGTKVTLNPTPESGWRFVGWWGVGCDARGREGPHAFELGSREYCLARFAPEAASSAEWRRTHASAVHAAAWSPSGDRLASSGGKGLVRLWDRQGAELRTLSGHEGKAVRALAWDATGTRLASGGADGQVRVWNAEDGTLVRPPLPHVNGPPEQPVSVEVHRVAFSPDGRLLASVSESKPEFSGNGTLRVWDLGTGAEVFRFPRRERWVQALTWTGEGRYLLAVDSDLTWERWDSQTGEVRRVDPGLKDQQSLAVALSPDGTRLALGVQDGLQVRSLATGELLQSKHLSEVSFGDLTPYALTWSPDGRYLAGGGVGGLVFTWDTNAGLASRVLGFHAGNVNTASWRADGTALTTGGSDAALSTWRLAP